MATYVPGVETYLPDIKPFTPDYKFLSAVLDVRTDKYNTNWKATNDLYNKVVYADLSRADTKEQRDQYINQIAPSLEKISGMDLSMVQNADSAKAVFAPFFEDDLIVSDIMHTTNYRKETDYANRLIDSPDAEQRKKYNSDGVRSLQYQMEDFITASPDKAMKMGLPQYVEGADLMGMAEKMLGEMKPPLKIKRESPQGDWIITQQNGTLVIPAATAYLEKTLMSDPRITRFYQNQAFVRSRDRAAEGMATGEFASVEQGQGVWAQETIDKITAQNEYYRKAELSKAAEGKTVEEKWINYQKTNGIVPGSDDEKAMNQQLSAYERTKAALEAREKIKELSNEPVKDFQTTLNKAYNLYSQATIGRDINTAAAVYASRDSEITIRENEFVKQKKQFQYDMAKIEAQGQNAEDLARLKGAIDYDLAKAKGEILYGADGKPLNPVLQAAQEQAALLGDITTTEFAVDKDGKPDANTEMYKKLVDDYTKVRTENRGESLDVATKILSFLKPAGDVDADGKPTQKYTIKVGGQNFTGSIDQIKSKLSVKEGGVYKYRDDITALYDQQSAILNDPKQMAKYPGKAKQQAYKDLYQQVYSDGGLNSKIKVTDNAFNEVSKIYKETHDKALVALRKSDPKLKELMDQGLPGLFTDGERPREMSPERYKEVVKSLAEQGKIKGIDRVQMRKKEYMNYVDTKFMQNGVERTNVEIVYSDKPLPNARKYYEVNSVMYTDKTGRLIRAQDRNQLDQKTVRPATVLSDADIEKKAEQAYKAIKTFTNSALTLHQGEQYRTATFKGYINGKEGGSDMFTDNIYKAAVDPLSATLEGQTMLAQMMRQKSMLDAKGGGYSMVLGNLKDATDEASIKDNELARRAYNAYIADMTTWLGNPKRSNDAGSAPRGSIAYKPTFGAASDGEKTTAGYTIDGFNQWLASKVKGSATEASGAAGEYGLFKKEEVEQLRNGISMVFDKQQDISPRSSNRQYYSKTLAAIQASPEKFVEYDYAGVDGLTPTATYRVVKTGTDEYYATYKVNTYQPNGTYTQSDWETIPINVSGFDAAREIDLQLQDIKSVLEQVRLKNLQDYDKNSASKGKGKN
jgi:hypothetical protein